MSEKKNLGGRPRLYENGSRNVTISLPIELAALLKELGGSHWIRDRLSEGQKASGKTKDKVQ
mgnify:CR=1 FL=1